MEILLIKDNVVESLSNVNSLADIVEYYPDYLCLERTGEETIGWHYVNGAFIPPSATALTGPTKITRLAFITRFTDAEAIAIDLASMGATVEAAAIRRAMKKIDAAEFIDLADPLSQQGVMALESIGLIGVGRANEILNNPIQVKELHQM